MYAETCSDKILDSQTQNHACMPEKKIFGGFSMEKSEMTSERDFLKE